MQLVASSPSELAFAQKETVEWCLKKIQTVRAELNDEEGILAEFKQAKWNTAKIRTRVNLLKKRMVFYGKMLKATKAGYFIVPNFVTDIFAVRTDTEWTTHRWGSAYQREDLREPVKALPAGEGE